NPIREQVEEVFKRDWASEYAHPLSQFQDITDINCLVGIACQMPQTTTEPITIKPPMNEDALKGFGMRIQPIFGVQLMIIAFSGNVIYSLHGLLLKSIKILLVSCAHIFRILTFKIKNQRCNEFPRE
ncbi:phospholipase D3, partial [Nephila pilipes]